LAGGKYTIEIYRQRAADIRFKARQAIDDATRDDLLRLADSWDRLANRSGSQQPAQPAPETPQRPKT
jgi:hypothetical protein